MKKIPEKTLKAASLKLKRRIAACIVCALAEDGSSMDTIDARLGKKRGYSQRFINSLIAGRANSLSTVSHILFAAGGAELSFSMSKPTEETKGKDA